MKRIRFVHVALAAVVVALAVPAAGVSKGSAVPTSVRITAAAPSVTGEQSVRFSGPATNGFLSEGVRQNS